MSEENGGKRITLKRSRPNPIFEDWLKELHEEAKEKKSKLEPILKEALESILKYPLPLNSGAECAILKGFDKKLCKFLDKRLDAYYSNMNDSEPGSEVTALSEANGSGQVSLKSSTSTKSSNGDSTNTGDVNKASNSADNGPPDSTSGQSEKGAKVPRIYKPVFRSGSYAILVALLEQLRDNPSKPALEKQELITLAQPYSEESFSRPQPDSYYTAWSNMKGLISKGLIVRTRSKKTMYSLSDEGIALAKQLLEDYKDRPTVNDMIFNGASTSNLNLMRNDDNLTPGGSTTSSQTVESITPVFSQTSSESVFIDMPADSFEIILLIDKNETGGVSKKNDPTVAQFKKYPDLKHEYRSLKVGDFTWVARHKDNKDHELVLPYIVERKRMDDFGASVKDGRFHEQKFRLRKCGLNNVIYLVENYGSNKHVGLPFQSLMQALANTRVQDEFKVHVTDSLNNSARFLAMMTKRLTIEYKDKHLIGRNQESQGEELMSFDYFNKASSKNKPLTVTEMFIKLLVQLKGLSVEKALAITKVYSTPKSLITEYEKCSQKEGETLLANLKYGTQNRNVGPSASKSIYRFFVWKQ